MKLKIVHQNQENPCGGEQVMEESDQVDGQMEATQMRHSLKDESMKENSPLLEISPITAYCPEPLSGKRKRKPNYLIDDFSLVIYRKKKKSSFSKSKNQGMSDCGGALTSKRDTTASGSKSHLQLKSPTLIRAEEVQLNLGNDQPSFLKVLVRSHVASCFWMGLPVPFCKLYLPSRDTAVNLENETGEVFTIKYIANKTGLSAGWRKFVCGNKLLEGDVLVFKLIGPCRFKVYIVRTNELTDVDGALSLLILDSQIKQSGAEGTVKTQSNKKRHPKTLPLTFLEKKKHIISRIRHPEEQSGNDSDEVASEVLECSKFPESVFNFKDIKSFDEFRIVVNEQCIDSELPEHIRRKYYELCCSKNAFLHDCLLPGLCYKLAAGMIFEVVNTADALRHCKVTASRSEFEVWEKFLMSFELLGLNVGFLMARLHRLFSLSFDSQAAIDTRRYLDAKKAHSHTGDEIQNLEAKLVELKGLSARYDHNIQNLKSKAESYDLKFREEANAECTCSACMSMKKYCSACVSMKNRDL